MGGRHLEAQWNRAAFLEEVDLSGRTWEVRKDSVGAPPTWTKT